MAIAAHHQQQASSTDSAKSAGTATASSSPAIALAQDQQVGEQGLLRERIGDRNLAGLRPGHLQARGTPRFLGHLAGLLAPALVLLPVLTGLNGTP